MSANRHKDKEIKMMNNEEKYIEQLVGRQNHFTTPEGYFDHLTEQIMQHIPQQPSRSALTVRLRPWLYVAACVAVIAVLTFTLFYDRAFSSEPAQTTVADMTNDSFMDDAADYAMFDNMDIYACLSDN